jgi:hypothetical protein
LPLEFAFENFDGTIKKEAAPHDYQVSCPSSIAMRITGRGLAALFVSFPCALRAILSVSTRIHSRSLQREFEEVIMGAPG